MEENSSGMLWRQKLIKHAEKDTGDTKHYKLDEFLQRNGKAEMILSNSWKLFL